SSERRRIQNTGSSGVGDSAVDECPQEAKSLDDWLRQQRSSSDHLQQVQLGQLKGRRRR
ncbi:unnamed protein product, partial [Urochloa humidicola]